jgi:phosphatidylglycerol:prolipoprotein diacylglycerol transferase
VRPILFEIFGWGVPSWHLFFVLAAFTGYLVAFLCARRAALAGYEGAQLFVDSLSHIFALCYVSGWFGARMLSIFVEQFDVKTPLQFLDALFSIGPMTFYGGAFAAVVCGGLYVKRRGLELKFALDCGIIGGVFALGVGRIGCHLNGDDFGLPLATQMNPPWWAVRYELLQDGGLYRYPVQLEETLASVLIGFVGLFLFKRTYLTRKIGGGFFQAGYPAAWVALLSAAHRYVNEGFRGDPRGLFFGTQISTSSGISLLIVCFCTYCLVRLRVSGRRRVPELPL